MARSYLMLYVFGIYAYFLPTAVARVAIVGGELAHDHQFPYQATLVINGFDECGAGIIDEQFILTAAHCVSELNGHLTSHRISILAGTNDLKKTGPPAKAIKVERIFVTKDFNIQSGTGDIAVLKLKRGLKLSEHIKVLQLPSHKDKVYQKQTATIAGFGWHWVKNLNGEDQGDTYDSHLRFAEVDVLTPCHVSHPKHVSAATHICAKIRQNPHSDPRGTCNGDSGGPLVQANIVIGVLSSSPVSCSERDFGALYTKVAHYLDFIHNAMHGIHKDMLTYP